MTPILHCSHLECGYDTSLFKALNINLEAGQSLSITGRSGIGKTTLLSTLLGLQRPIAGTVEIDGEDVHQLSFDQCARVRNEKIGTVFQHSELLGRYTALDNVMLPRLLLDSHDPTACEDALELLERLDVYPDRLAENLSGGERSRVSLARALINKPLLLLADEPTGSLDTDLREEVIELIFNAVDELQCALVFVTHDKALAERADSTIGLSQ